MKEEGNLKCEGWNDQQELGLSTTLFIKHSGKRWKPCLPDVHKHNMFLDMAFRFYPSMSTSINLQLRMTVTKKHHVQLIKL